jgi:hypothetical protein
MSELAKTTQNLRFGKGDKEEQEPNREGKGNKRSQKDKTKQGADRCLNKSSF